jgi:hypothetical protein
MTTQRILEDTITAVRGREAELVEAMVARNVAEVSNLGPAAEEPDVLAAIRESARANLRTALDALLRDRRPPAHLPTGAVEEARAAARAGVSLDALAHTYRVGHAVVWDAFIEEVERLDLDRDSRAEILRLLSRFTFAYIESVVPAVTREYESERGRLERRHEQVRFDLVMSVLEGSNIDARRLGYDLELDHLGLVGWGTSPAAGIHALAGLLERPLLCVEVGDRTAWGWIGGREPLAADDREKIARLRLPPGAALAYGEAAPGAPGFRLTHRQAQRAWRIACRSDRALVGFADVALESLLVADEEAAREFVQRELDFITRAKEAPKLRDTLVAYCESGFNAAAAAARLGVNDRTVAYRIRLLEQLLDAPLASRRVEIEVALRLERLFRNP